MFTASNLIEIQRMDRLRIATWRIFQEKIFYIFEKLNYQCKVNIIFIKSFYLNGKTKCYEIILALLENFFILLRIFSKPKMYVLNNSTLKEPSRSLFLYWSMIV